MVLENLNESIDPCEDFYEYACGRWATSNPRPQGTTVWNIRLIVREMIDRRIEEFMNSGPQPEDIESVKIAKKWYLTCMDRGEHEKRGLGPIIEVLNEAGGWPLTMGGKTIGPWDEIEDFYSRKIGADCFYELKVAKNNAVLDMPNMPPGTWILDASEESKYAMFIHEIGNFIAKEKGYEIPKEEMMNDIRDMLRFQIKLSQLANLGDDKVQMNLDSFNDWYNNVGTNDIQIDWVKKIKEIFSTAGIDIEDNLNVTITSPKYFQDLHELLNVTPNRTIVNYIHWHFVSGSLTYTSQQMREIYNKLTSSSPLDEETELDRSTNCISQINMEDIVGYQFVRKYFSDDLIDEAHEMIDDITYEVELQVKRSKWADVETKNLILDKIKKIKRYIGYPEWYRDKTTVENYYNGLIVGEDFFQNVINWKLFTRKGELRQLHQTHDNNNMNHNFKRWLVDPTTINAYYKQLTNALIIPAANFQLPYFGFHRPSVINYAAIGFLMSHEIQHAFDTRAGIRYRESSNSKDTFSKIMTNHYDKRVRCFVEQYNNYTLVGNRSVSFIKDYGEQTKDENMADAMGLQVAFQAFRQKKLKDTIIPGLEGFTNDQIFFLSFANLWCEEIDDESVMDIETKSAHSTSELRVRGSLSNSQDFANAWNCSVGSRMNPKKKCRIWLR